MMSKAEVLLTFPHVVHGRVDLGTCACMAILTAIAHSKSVWGRTKKGSIHPQHRISLLNILLSTSSSMGGYGGGGGGGGGALLEVEDCCLPYMQACQVFFPSAHTNNFYETNC